MIRALHRSAPFCKRRFGLLSSILTDLRFSGDDVVICLSDKIEDTSLEALIKLGLRTRFPDECTAWERRRKEVKQGFVGTVTERQDEVHFKLEQSFKDIRVKLQGAVVADVLKAFPWVLSTPKSLCMSSFMAAPN